MRLSILAVGKLKDGAERDLVDKYVARAGKSGRPLGFTKITADDFSESRLTETAQRKSEEALRLLSRAGDGAYLVALDENGELLTSSTFAERVSAVRDDGRTAIVFLIGGPDGHGNEVLQKADLMLSLGRITLPHGLARVVLAEQIYRAFTILAGHPYHRS